VIEKPPMVSADLGLGRAGFLGRTAHALPRLLYGSSAGRIETSFDVLCDGWLDDHHGEVTLRACVLGGNQLTERDDWILSYVQPDLVKRVSARIDEIDEAWFRSRYFLLDELPEGVTGSWRYQLKPSEQDFEYMWSYFGAVREFYKRAATRGLAVLFAVDQ